MGLRFMAESGHFSMANSVPLTLPLFAKNAIIIIIEKIYCITRW